MANKIEPKKLNSNGVVEFENKVIQDMEEFFDKDVSENEDLATLEDYLSCKESLSVSSVKGCDFKYFHKHETKNSKCCEGQKIKSKNKDLFKTKDPFIKTKIPLKSCEQSFCQSKTCHFATDDLHLLSGCHFKKKKVCMMCKGELSIIDKHIEMRNCGHIFHKKCFDKKQKKFDCLSGNKLKIQGKKCPICKEWNKYKSELLMKKYKSI